MKHLPNVITITRIVLTPVLLGLLMVDALWARASALGLFAVAAVSDYVDGRLARNYEVHSRLGRFLDPFADKVLVLGTFAALALLIPTIVPWWAVLVIALRDLFVTGLRTWVEAQGRSLKTLALAKAKTALQLGFLAVMIVLLVGDKMSGSIGAGAQRILAGPVPFLVLLALVGFTVLTGVLYAFRQKTVAPAKLKS